MNMVENYRKRKILRYMWILSQDENGVIVKLSITLLLQPKSNSSVALAMNAERMKVAGYLHRNSELRSRRKVDTFVGWRSMYKSRFMNRMRAFKKCFIYWLWGSTLPEVGASQPRWSTVHHSKLRTEGYCSSLVIGIVYKLSKLCEGSRLIGYVWCTTCS